MSNELDEADKLAERYRNQVIGATIRSLVARVRRTESVNKSWEERWHRIAGGPEALSLVENGATIVGLSSSLAASQAREARVRVALVKLKHLVDPALERLPPVTLEQEANRIIDNALATPSPGPVDALVEAAREVMERLEELTGGYWEEAQQAAAERDVAEEKRLLGLHNIFAGLGHKIGAALQPFLEKEKSDGQ